jgi:hypothetical protein
MSTIANARFDVEAALAFVREHGVETPFPQGVPAQAREQAARRTEQEALAALAAATARRGAP